MNPVEQFFTRRFLNLYGPPNAVDPTTFVAEYDKALGGTHPSLLEAASDRVVRSHTYRNWPTVGECVAMVNTVAAERDGLRMASALPKRETRPIYSADARARVDALLQETLTKLRTVDEDGPGSLNKFDLKRTSKPEFERMQRESPNSFHRGGGKTA